MSLELWCRRVLDVPLSIGAAAAARVAGTNPACGAGVIEAVRALRVAVVGTSLDILGGQGVQACRLIDGLDAEGCG